MRLLREKLLQMPVIYRVKVFELSHGAVSELTFIASGADFVGLNRYIQTFKISVKLASIALRRIGFFFYM